MHIINEEAGGGTNRAAKDESEVLKGNPLGDPHVRDLCVYLPPGYSVLDKSYPS